MDDTQYLLDSPKRKSLQQHSVDLRSALKDFERLFAKQNGRKPKQTDIKSNENIAAKYKEYHRVQDVLTGVLPYEKYTSARATTKVRSARHTRTDSGLGSSPRPDSQNVHATPRKHRRRDVVDDDKDADLFPPMNAVNAIGPTPHRDGKVLGLFDLVPGSGPSAATPSASARKRKAEGLYEDTPAKRPPLQVIQTPSQRPNKTRGDILDFLSGTPQKSLELNKKHSRTPQSEGRKFELSQFFATPKAQRLLFSKVEPDAMEQIFEQPSVVDRTPHREPDATGMDATPAYLRRSTSFKDRLLSTCGPTDAKSSLLRRHTGPPTLRHFRSSTSNIPRLDRRSSSPTYDQPDEYDDDMEALRELEAGINQHSDFSGHLHNLTGDAGQDFGQVEPTREYKKKGQKRTTKKANIKPIAPKATKEPQYVAADEHVTDNEFETYDDFNDDDLNGGITLAVVTQDEHGKRGRKDAKAADGKRKAGTINPNAQSHTNYRSLKIKNKSSKARAPGRSRFKGRR